MSRATFGCFALLSMPSAKLSFKVVCDYCKRCSFDFPATNRTFRHWNAIVEMWFLFFTITFLAPSSTAREPAQHVRKETLLHRRRDAVVNRENVSLSLCLSPSHFWWHAPSCHQSSHRSPYGGRCEPFRGLSSNNGNPGNSTRTTKDPLNSGKTREINLEIYFKNLEKCYDPVRIRWNRRKTFFLFFFKSMNPVKPINQFPLGQGSTR